MNRLHCSGLLLAFACLTAASARAQQVGAGGGRGSLTGLVLDDAGFPLVGATVALPSAGGTAVSTRSDGRFRFGAVPSGALAVRVRRLGYMQRDSTIRVVAGEEVELELRMQPVARLLAPVTVFEVREVYDARLAGFHARSRARKGGYFITRDRLQRSTSWSLPDLLRQVPGARVAPVNGINKAVRFRGARCAPVVFVDGFAASAGEFDLEMLPVASLEGVEVYSSMASVPAELDAPHGASRCGVIAVWSRPAPGRRDRTPSVAPVDLERVVADGEVFTADQVQVTAQLDTAASPPIGYPDSLWRAGRGGRVVLELVVGTDGEVEPGTVRIVSSTHPAFAEAARVALSVSYFTPAVLGRRAVRQLVQLPIVFVPGMSP